MRILLLAIVASLCACRSQREASPPSSSIPIGEGRLAVSGGSIWYRVSGSGQETPLVLLHGGPGLSSYYLKPLEAIGDDRVVVRYDQLGGGRSDSTADTTLFTIAHFVEELDSLRAALGITQWHVLGHSWGTILALEYYRAHPDRVTSLVFGSPVFDFPAYTQRARQLVSSLSDSSQRAIASAEKAGHFESPAFEAAVNEFYAQHVFRRPVQADLDSSLATFNLQIYNYMQGPSEFTITGTLKDYNATAFLPRIDVPVLLTVGEFDSVGPDLVRQHAAMIPGAKVELLAGAAHLTTWDARDENVRVVREFLRAADAKAASAP